MITENFGIYIRGLREQAQMPLRKLAASLDIDQSTLSKIERGERQFTSDMISKLAETLSLDYKDLKIRFLADRLSNDLINEDFALEALKETEKLLKTHNE
jgi:transcriptional regulator with XRE-family HTH domain